MRQVFTLIGDYDKVFKVLEQLKVLSAGYGLQLQASKCQVLMPKGYTGHEQDATFTAISDLCKAHEIKHYGCNIRVLGVLLSNGDLNAEQAIRTHINSVVASHDELFHQLSHLPVQIAMLLLRLCMLPRLMHFMRSLPPRYVKEAAVQFDEAVRESFAAIMEIPTGETPLTAQEQFQIGLKVSKGGVGLRSMVLVLYAAYFSSVVPVLSHLKKLFPARKHDLAHSPIQSDLLDCMRELKQQGVTDEEMMKLGVATSPISDTTDTAQAMMQLWDGNAENASTAGLQRKLTHWIEDKLYDDFMSSVPEDDPMRIRLLSASGKGASLWQTVIPTEKLLIVTDENYRFEMRTLLGRMATEKLNNHECLCGQILKDTTHSHFQDCKKLNGAKIARHDRVRDTLVTFMKECSDGGTGYIEVEPKANVYRDPNKPNSRERADIVLVNRNISAMIDVTIVDPTNVTNSRLPSIGTKRLASLEHAVHGKIAKHNDRAEEMGLKLCVFAMESYGSIHPAGIKLLKNVARYADYNATKSEVGNLLLRGMSLLSVALHNGNGRISDMGCDLSRPYTNGCSRSIVSSSRPYRSTSASMRVVVSSRNHHALGADFASALQPSAVRSLSSVL